MRSYILKRLLLMIPTFFGISLVVFLVLNLAPGRPGALRQSGDVISYMRGEQSEESVRIFREQFNLDKPILLNWRFTLKESQVLALLRTIAAGPKTTSGQKIRAYEQLEDFGYYAIPYLVHIMQSEKDALPRDLAVQFLRINSRQRLPYLTFDPNDTAKRKANQAVDVENVTLRRWRYAADAPEAEQQKVIAQWSNWYEQHRERWEYSAWRKVHIFFLETRFATYWNNLLHLDFGVSLVTRDPVFRTLLSKLKYSMSLSLSSLLLAYLIAIPLGIFSAVRKDSLTDRTMTVALFMLYSLPEFFVAILLLNYVSLASDQAHLRWFPIGGWQSANPLQLTTFGQIRDIAWHMVLPVACLTYGSLAALSRYMRAGLLDVIRSDFIRTARAKGLSERVVILKHAVRNGLLPILTLLAGLLPAVLGSSVILEFIFAIPGMGLWMIDSIYQRDYNVIMAVSLIEAVLTLFGILLSDIDYALVDPRITYR